MNCSVVVVVVVVLVVQVFYYHIYCNVEEKDIHRAGGVRDGAYIGKKSTVYELSF